MQDDNSGGFSATEFIAQTDPPKIRVVVRKRPLNNKASSGMTCMPRADCVAAPLVELRNELMQHSRCFSLNWQVTYFL